MTDEVFRPLDSTADWNDALEQSTQTPVLVFKHSATCSISAKANEEMSTLSVEEDLPIFRVVVQESRSVSDEIAESLNVRHETPQAILIRDEKAIFDTSHLNVTVDSLRKELRRTPAE
jgi:bacillithiol system protein YtxJ